LKRLVLVRHGESLWNAEGRIQGQRCAGLSATGHEQAKAVARSLAESYPDAVLVTSDLQRTLETVAPLEAELGRAARVDAGLRERSFGAWEGRLREDVQREDVERWGRWVAGEDVVPELGGESGSQLIDRVVPVLRGLIVSTPVDGVTVAVTHGGPVWHGTHELLGMRRGTLGSVGNGAVTEFVTWTMRGAPDAGETVVLDRWNQLTHLPSELRTTWSPRQSSDAPPVGR
jgi:glucosyl-3-phosphoglycerate phosphatase